MEEIHEISKAYYNNLTETQKKSAEKMFHSIDLNGDGSVSLREYFEIFGKKASKLCNNRKFFKELDRNGDGKLDLEEFLSLYYIVKTQRLIFCDGIRCGEFLKGLHFTCVSCFCGGKNTFDLCSSCFAAKNFRHDHATFLDNFALLRCIGAANDSEHSAAMEQPHSIAFSSASLAEGSYTSSVPATTKRSSSSRTTINKTEEATKSLTVGLKIIQAITEIGSNCNIQ